MTAGAGIAIALGAAIVVGGGAYLYLRSREGGGNGSAGYGAPGAGEFGGAGGGGATLPSAVAIARRTGVRRVGGSITNYGKDLTPKTPVGRSDAIAAGRRRAYNQQKTSALVIRPPRQPGPGLVVK